MSVFRPDRRDFLKVTGLAGLALVLGVPVVGRFARAEGEALAPNLFVRVGTDGSVRFVSTRSEMGQGVKTAIAMILADELDVDLDHVEIVQADGDSRYGSQSTGGSRSIREHFGPLRLAAATARAMLVGAAADRWGVQPSSCRTEPGVVVHDPSKRRAAYADLVADAASRPVPGNPPLKDPTQWRYIGKKHRNVDVPDIVRGKAVYGADIALPGMLYAVVERSPRVHGTLKSVDDRAARAVSGVVDVVTLAPAQGLTDAGVAVLGTTTWAAMQGRKALKCTWAPGTRPAEDTDAYKAALKAAAESPGRVVRHEGDVDRALAKAHRVVEASYTGPHLEHAPMEPPAATARFQDGRCEVWLPTQAPQWARKMIADRLGIAPDAVTVHVTLLGGAFGRKSMPDFALEVAELARAAGKPVHLQWTREDTTRHGFYRAQNHQFLRAGLGKDGKPVAWLHRTAFPGIGWRPKSRGPGDGELSQGFTNLPYRIPNLRMEAGTAPTALRIGWFRSVCNTFHAFAVNGFLDELAHAAGQDTVQYHLDLLGPPRIIGDEGAWPFDTGRLSGVIQRVAKEAGWGRKLPLRHGLGFAAHYSFHSYAASVIHASVSPKGELTVHEAHTAVDCGRVVNPDTVEAQMQGAIAMALSFALHQAITVKDGVVQQGNFGDYPMLRFHEMPETKVHIVQSTAAPSGIGEPGLPPIAPALTNAIFAATGKRLRDLPLAGQDLG